MPTRIEAPVDDIVEDIEAAPPVRTLVVEDVEEDIIEAAPPMRTPSPTIAEIIAQGSAEEENKETLAERIARRLLSPDPSLPPSPPGRNPLGRSGTMGRLLMPTKQMTSVSMVGQLGRVAPGEGKWKAERGECTRDYKTCCAVCWCPCVTTAQLYIHALSKPMRRFRPLCLALGCSALTWWLCAILALAWLQSWLDVFSQLAVQFPGVWNYFGHVPARLIAGSAVAGAAGLALIIVSTVVLYQVRTTVRERDSIPGGAFNVSCDACRVGRVDCATCGDCLLACLPCTGPCVACQLLRHEGLKGSKYKLRSVDGHAPAKVRPGGTLRYITT